MVNNGQTLRKRTLHCVMEKKNMSEPLSVFLFCLNVDTMVAWGLMPFSVVPGLVVGLMTRSPLLAFGSTAIACLMFEFFGEMVKWIARRFWGRKSCDIITRRV